jgi:hypothetical protein
MVSGEALNVLVGGRAEAFAALSLNGAPLGLLPASDFGAINHGPTRARRLPHLTRSTRISAQLSDAVHSRSLIPNCSDRGNNAFQRPGADRQPGLAGGARDPCTHPHQIDGRGHTTAEKVGAFNAFARRRSGRHTASELRRRVTDGGRVAAASSTRIDGHSTSAYRTFLGLPEGWRSTTDNGRAGGGSPPTSPG